MMFQLFRYVLVIAGLAAMPVITPRQQVNSDLNVTRATYGLAPLADRNDLDTIALERADEILDGSQPWGHIGNDGTLRFVTLTEGAHIDYGRLGEDLAMSNAGDLPARTVQMWMASPSHKAIILDSVYTAVGIGCDKRADMEVCAAIFWGAP